MKKTISSVAIAASLISGVSVNALADNANATKPNMVGNETAALPPIMVNVDAPADPKNKIELTKNRKIIVLYSKSKQNEKVWKLAKATLGVTFTPAKTHDTWESHPSVNVGKNTAGFFTIVNDKNVKKTYNFEVVPK